MTTNMYLPLVTTTDLGRAAREYAAAGVPIFPLWPGQKTPACEHGFKDASTDPAWIERHWPTDCDDLPNIGVSPEHIGMAVLDLERDCFEMFPDTLASVSASGGTHLYYWGSIASSQKKLGPTVDTRGVDGYVLLPPSVIDERDGKAVKDPTRCGVYRWADEPRPVAKLPQDIVDRLGAARTKPERRTTPSDRDIDTPRRIAWMRSLARTWPPATIGEGSDSATIALVDVLLDWCSQEPVIEAMVDEWMPRCIDGYGECWDAAWIAMKVNGRNPANRDHDIGSAECLSDQYGKLDEEQPEPAPNEETARSGVVLIGGGKMKPTKVEWLWPQWLALGKYHLLGGPKGAGKSTLMFTLMAAATGGTVWPDSTKVKEPGDWLVWSSEDDFQDTILPRFMAAGGDPDRLFFVGGVTNENGNKRAFDPSIDLPQLKVAARQLPNLRGITIDPVVMAVAGDSHKNAETRRGLQPLVDLAAELGIVLVGITHFTKGTEGKDPMERFTGSLAFGALARVCFGVAVSEDGTKRRFVRVASNIGKSGGGFEYTLEQVPLVGFDMTAQRVKWGIVLDGPARGLLNMGDNASSKIVEAETFILQAVPQREGLSSVNLEETAAEARGIAGATLRRAKERLCTQGLIAVRKVAGQWMVYRTDMLKGVADRITSLH